MHPNPPRVETAPFVLITAGIGSYWSAAGGGLVAMAGLALLFAGDLWRLLQWERRARVPAGEAVSVTWSGIPMVLMGVAANEGFLDLFGALPTSRLVDGLRAGAALYAVAVLWSVSPAAPRDVWGRILGLQIGGAQSLLLGVPLGWLIRPAVLTADRPHVSGWVAVVAGALWILGAWRWRSRRGLSVRRAAPGLGLVGLAVLLLGVLLAGQLPGGETASRDALRLPAAVGFLTACAGVVCFWKSGTDAGRGTSKQEQLRNREVHHDPHHVDDGGDESR
jgi:hypothetical protein